MEAVLGGLGWGEEGTQEAREVTIDGGVGERFERFGVFDEEGAGAAGGTGAGEGELESLEPGGGIDGVGGVTRCAARSVWLSLNQEPPIFFHKNPCLSVKSPKFHP